MSTPRPLISAPASPERSSPETYIAMPSLSHGGVRAEVRLASAVWTSSWAITLRRSSAPRLPYERHRTNTRWPQISSMRFAGPLVEYWFSATAVSDFSVLMSLVSALVSVLLRATMTSTFFGALTPGSPRFIRL